MFKCVYNCGTYREDLDLLICRPRGELTSDKMHDVATCRKEKGSGTDIRLFHSDLCFAFLGTLLCLLKAFAVDAKLRRKQC